jgi:hypothetical protein
MIRPDDAAAEERGLVPHDAPPLPVPLAAMAEAMRANAEALHRIDQSQRRIAESIEKSERAQQVVASTRTLNDTFRGLSEIQRGLLDALVKSNKGGGGASPLLLALAAILSGLLCVLVYDRWASDRTVPKQRYDDARGEIDTLHGKIEELKAAGAAGAVREREAGKKLSDGEQALAAAARDANETQSKIRELESDLREKEARLEQFLAVKAQADLAGALQIQNQGLEREVRELKEQIGGLQRERANALEVYGDRLVELGDRVDPEALKAIAKQMKIYEDPPPRAPPGTVTLSRSAERLLVGQVNRLLPDGEESYDLVHATAVAGGCRLTDVTLTRSKNRLLVNSITCKEMAIHVDAESGTVELRLKDGVITNPVRTGEKIPIGPDGHSVFLRDAAVREWLRREGDRVAVDAEGQVTWP